MKTTLKTLGKVKARANAESVYNGKKYRFKLTTRGLLLWKKGSRHKKIVQFPELAGFAELGKSVQELRDALDGQRSWFKAV